MNHLNLYSSNDIIANVSYLQQYYSSQISLVSIENFNSSEFSYIVNSQNIVEGQTHAIIFDFNRTITHLDQIHIEISFYSNTQSDQLISQQVFIVKSINQQILNQEQNQTIYNLQAAQSGIQISLIVSAFFAAILGGFEYILAICDIITWLSTFYYLNITYPYNVNFIFENINLQQFLFLPSFNSPFNQEGDPYYFVSPYKFMQNQVDPLFINNVFNDCVLITFPVFLYIFSKIYLYFEKRFNMRSYIKNTNYRKDYCVRILQHIRKKALYFTIYFKAIMLKQIHLNMLDLVMACCLQLMTNPPNNYPIVFTNTLIAVLTMILIGYLCLQIYLSAKQNKLIYQTHFFKETYESIYDNLKIERLDQRFYGCIIIYSKIIYIIILVSCYDHPILQTAGCGCQYFLLIVYLWYVNPYNSLSKYCQEVIPNFCVFSIMLVTVFLAINEQMKFTQDIENIGWIIITFISISIMSQLSFLIARITRELISNF